MPRPSRRQLLTAFAVAAVGPLAACTGTPSPGPSSPTSPSPSPSGLPFGLVTPSRVEAVVFDGAFGVGYVEAAAATMSANHPGVTVRVRPVQDIIAVVEPRLAEGGTPPDLVDNSGARLLPVAKLADQFAELDDLMDSASLDGGVLRDTLQHDVLATGTFNDRLIALNYALSVFGLWHSAADFAAAGWEVPRTWDRMFELGAAAKEQGQFLFAWGDEAADYYQELAIASAVKEGGHEVRIALDSLADGAWSHPAVTAVLEQLEAIVAAGFVVHGGDYLTAQASWLKDRAALLYPAGSWLPTEMSEQLPADYALSVAPVPTLTAAPVLPHAAVHATPTEQFLVPRRAANVAGAFELLRTMLTREAATEFSREHLVPTIVRESVPADVTDTALTSQARLLADAGANVFSWRFVAHYGLSGESNVAWADFLSGRITASVLAARLQTLSDRVRNDPAVERYAVE